jgi:hypothetical protein
LAVHFPLSPARGEGVQEIDVVEEWGLNVPAQLVEGVTVQPGSPVPIINVLFYQDVTGRLDLAFQDCNLALDRALFILQIRAYAGVQGRLLHIPPLIPE